MQYKGFRLIVTGLTALTELMQLTELTGKWCLDSSNMTLNMQPTNLQQLWDAVMSILTKISTNVSNILLKDGMEINDEGNSGSKRGPTFY